MELDRLAVLLADKRLDQDMFGSRRADKPGEKAALLLADFVDMRL